MTDRRPGPGWYYFCYWLSLTLEKLLLRVAIHGREHVPPVGPFIVAANHASYLDPPLSGAGVRPPLIVRFVGRSSLFKHPALGWLLTRLFVIPIERDSGDIGALRSCLKALKEGAILGVFPEGTRTRDGHLQAPKGGIGFMLAKARVPVVPTYISGTRRALPRGAAWVRPVKVTVTYGPPITPGEIAAVGTDRDAYDQIGALVMSRIATLQSNAAAGAAAGTTAH